MDWIVALATGIAVLRLLLICGGMWILLRSTARPGVLLDFQRKCFTAAGVIYLLGILPQSLLLLLVNSNLANSVLDNGYLCWAQNLACMVAATLHSVVFLKWIADAIAHGSQKTCVSSILRHQIFGYCLITYTAAIIFCKSIFLQGDDKSYYTDIAEKPSDTTTAQWSISTVQNPSQVVRLQLLLCECSLSAGKTLNYLITSYLFLFLPFLMLCFLLVQRFRASNSTKDTIEITDNVEGSTWWEREINIQRLLSTSLALWCHLVQPILFSLHTEHFVDFGSHLLLTICVFIPWTHSEADYNPGRRWV